MRDVAYVTWSVANVTDSIVQRYPIVFIHTYSDKWIRWSILLSIWTALFVSLEWIYAFSIYLFYLIIIILLLVILSLLCIGFVVVLLSIHQMVVVRFQLLRFWDCVCLIVLLTCYVHIILDIWQLWLVVLVFGTSLRVLDWHIRLHVPIIQSLNILFFLIIRHVDLAVKSSLTQNPIMWWAIVLASRRLPELSGNWLQLAISLRRSDIWLFFCYLR